MITPKELLIVKYMYSSHEVAMDNFYKEFPTVDTYPSLKGDDKENEISYYHFVKQAQFVFNKLNDFWEKVPCSRQGFEKWKIEMIIKEKEWLRIKGDYNINKPFNQDESFREACAKTQHNWAMDSSHQIDLTAYSGYRGNPHQIHVGAKCLTCGYCACKHCEFFNVVNECEGEKNDS